MTDAQKQELEQLIETMVSTNIYDYAVQKLIYNLEQNGTHSDILHKLKTEFPPLVIPPKLTINGKSYNYVEGCLNAVRRGLHPLLDPDPVVFTKSEKEKTEQVLRQLDFGSVHSYAKAQFINYLEGCIAAMQTNIKNYEAKYKMSYKEMSENYHQITGFGEFEKEDDEMQWEGDVEFAESFLETLNELRNE